MSQPELRILVCLGPDATEAFEAARERAETCGPAAHLQQGPFARALVLWALSRATDADWSAMIAGSTRQLGRPSSRPSCGPPPGRPKF